MQRLQSQTVSQLQELSYLYHGGNVSSSFLAKLIRELELLHLEKKMVRVDLTKEYKYLKEKNE